MQQDYSDIIHLPHFVSTRHAPMPMVDRGAQFSPFAALTGYDATIEEAGRLTDAGVELGADVVALLDEMLRWLSTREEPLATLTWFAPDSWKEGGSYRTVTGHIDTYARVVLLTEGESIPLDSICHIESE